MFNRYVTAAGIQIDIDSTYPWISSLMDFMPGSKLLNQSVNPLPDLILLYDKHKEACSSLEIRSGFRLEDNFVVDLKRGYAVGREGASLVIRTSKSCYYIFQMCLQILLLEKEMTWIHGAGFTDGKSSTVIAGWPGAGKTTCAYSLAQHFGWQTLGDELVIVDKSGSVIPQLKPFYLYDYHGEVYPQLRSLKSSSENKSKKAARQINRLSRNVKNILLRFSGIQEFLRGRNPCNHKILPQEIFGTKGLGTSAPLKTLVWIERVNENHKGDHDLSTLPSRLMGSMLNEFGDREIAMLNLLIGNGVLSADHTYSRWSELLNTTCREIKTLLVEIPDDTPVADLPTYLIEALETKHLDRLI